MFTFVTGFLLCSLAPLGIASLTVPFFYGPWARERWDHLERAPLWLRVPAYKTVSWGLLTLLLAYMGLLWRREHSVWLAASGFVLAPLLLFWPAVLLRRARRFRTPSRCVALYSVLHHLAAAWLCLPPKLELGVYHRTLEDWPLYVGISLFGALLGLWLGIAGDRALAPPPLPEMRGPFRTIHADLSASAHRGRTKAVAESLGR